LPSTKKENAMSKAREELIDAIGENNPDAMEKIIKADPAVLTTKNKHGGNLWHDIANSPT
jgi:hypothetical protein